MSSRFNDDRLPRRRWFHWVAMWAAILVLWGFAALCGAVMGQERRSRAGRAR